MFGLLDKIGRLIIIVANQVRADETREGDIHYAIVIAYLKC